MNLENLVDLENSSMSIIHRYFGQNPGDSTPSFDAIDRPLRSTSNRSRFDRPFLSGHLFLILGTYTLNEDAQFCPDLSTSAYMSELGTKLLIISHEFGKLWKQ